MATPLYRAVNVASVPNRSPFRYAGGKTWFVPRLRQWLRSRRDKPALFIEPFAGGGISSLTVAFERLAAHSLLVELDSEVAAVWQTLIHGDIERLATRILEFDLTAETVRQLLDTHFDTIDDVAFQTIVKNRVTRGGILASGVGLINLGEDGKGIASRWYPATLRQRMLDIQTVRQTMTFLQGDGLAVMAHYAAQSNAVFFIDPPYTAAGKSAGTRLYRHSQIAHEQLFEIASSLAGDFLMTYDNESGARQLAAHHGFDSEPIAMKNTHHSTMTELIIGRDLAWLREQPFEQQRLDPAL